MATLNKQYTLNMQMSDGTTKSASFVIPVNQPAAAEVPCDEVWSKTIQITNFSLGYDGTTYSGSKDFEFKAALNESSIQVSHDRLALPASAGWSYSLSSDKKTVTVRYSNSETTAQSGITVTVTANLIPTVDNYLTYLYNNKK